MKKDLMQTHIINKILEYKPEAVSTLDFMKHVFSVHTRTISAYRTKSDLILNGAMLNEDFIPETRQNLAEFRRVKRHTLLWVRCDLIQPNHIEIEHKNKIFVMTRFEWTLLKRNIKLVAKNEDI